MFRIYLKSQSRRDISLPKRDLFAISALERNKLKNIEDCFKSCALALKLLQIYDDGSHDEIQSRLKKVLLRLYDESFTLRAVEVPIVESHRRKVRSRTIEDFRYLLTSRTESFSSKFRFTSPEQLHALVTGFKLPPIIRVKGYKFSNEEVLMIALMRLSYPHRWEDVQQYFPGRDRQALQKAFYWFLDFMVENWAYLVTNNTEYWNEELPDFAEAIRMKFQRLPNESFRQYFPPAGERNGFSVFGFIDNTILPICRPGGGPIRGGEQSMRNPTLLQRAFYTGWKKRHAIKFQTVDLPNGMNYDVWGASSARHNDCYTLSKSGILDRLCFEQRIWPVKFKMLGDSAYSEGINMQIVGNGRGWSSLREPIEWDYKDLKTQWKYLDYSHGLKLRSQPVAKITLVCFILRNAYVTMNGSQTSLYYRCDPPAFEHWTSQGPRAKPIPDSIRF